MSENNTITKVYDLKQVGGEQTYNQLVKINAIFKEIAKNKTSLGNINITNNFDTSKLDGVSDKFNELIDGNKELIAQMKILTTTMANFGQVGSKMAADIAASMKKVDMTTAQNTEGFVKFTGTMANAKNSAAGYRQAVFNLGSRLSVLKIESTATSESIKILGEQYKENEISQQEYDSEMAILTTHLQQVRTQITEVSGAMTTMNKTLNPALLENETAALYENKVELLQRNQLLKLQAVAESAVTGSRGEARANAALLRKELDQLNVTTDEGIIAQKKLIAEIDELDAFINANSEAYTRRKINIGNYPELTIQAQELKTKMDELTASGETETEVFKQLEVESLKLAAAMKSATSPTGGSGIVTTSQQLSQLKVNMQGLVAAGKEDSIEFREMQAEAQKLSAAINEVNASIKKATTVADQFGNIVERMGLRMIANMLIIQVAIELLGEIQKRYEDSIQRQAASQNALIKMNEEAAETFTQSAIKIDAYRKRFEDATTSIEDKKEVIRDLNDQFKDQIDHINGINDAEAFFRDKTDAFIESLQLRAKALGAMSAAQELTKQNLINAANGGGNLLDNFDAILAGVGSSVGISPATTLYKTAQERLKDTTDANVKAIKLLFSEYIKSSNEAAANDRKNGFDTDPDTKEHKTKKAYDPTNRDLKIEQEITKEIAAEYAKRLQIEAETQKMIADDESKSLSERLQAYMRYSNRELLAKQVLLDAEFNENVAALSRIAGIEGKKEALRTQQEKDLLAKKQLFLSKINTIDAQNGLLEIQALENRQKAIADITRQHYASQLKDLDRYLDIKNIIIEEKYNQKNEGIYRGGGNQTIKGERINKSGLQEAVDKDQAQLEVDTNKYAELNDNLFRLQQQKDQNAAIVKLEKDLQGELLSIRKKAAEDKAKLQRDTHSLEIADEEKAKKLRLQIEMSAIEVATSFANEYMAFLERQDAYKQRQQQKQMDWNQKVLNSQTQSNQQRLQQDKAYYIADQQAEKEKMAQEKKRAQAKAAIDYASAAITLIAKAVDEGGLASVIVQEAALNAIFLAKEAMLSKSETFGLGGDVPSSGGMFGGQSHSMGGTPFLFGGGRFEAEAGELAIINKRSSSSNDRLSVTGTPKQIASAINSYGGGKQFAPGAQLHRFDYGGLLGSQITPPSFLSSYYSTGAEDRLNQKDIYKTLQAHSQVLIEHTQSLSRESSRPVVLNPHHVDNYLNNHSKSLRIGII